MSTPRLNAAETLALAAYQLVANTALPLGLLLGAPLFALSEKRRATVFRRAGFQTLPRFADRPRPLWIHTLSLGEVLSATALVRELRARLPDRPIVFSASTRSGRAMAEQRLAGVADAFLYFPFDMIPATARVLNVLDPALLVFVETDLWPGFLASVRRRGIPAMLVNARLSPRTFASTRRFRWLFGPALRTFQTIVPQSDGEAERYRAVGVRAAQLAAPGNFKFDAAGGNVSPEDAAALRRELGFAEGDRVWIAGSTHPGEEAALLRVWKALHASRQDAGPPLRLVLAPRQPARADEVLRLWGEAGFPARKFSEAVTSKPDATVVVDVLGRLAKLYAAADVAFTGGSLVPHGGQSPIEPAAAGVPVLFGPHMSSFPDVSRALVTADAAVLVADESALLAELRTLLDNPVRARRMGENGRRLVGANRGATARAAGLIAARLSA